MNRIIEVLIAPNGETTIQTKGYAGSACQAASQFLEALGIVIADRPTSEFYAETQAEQQQQQHA
jgi:hypothetical protein